MEKNTEIKNKYKILIVGGTTTGKSSTLLRYENNQIFMKGEARYSFEGKVLIIKRGKKNYYLGMVK